ncbi:MAG: magnesium transporter [Deltaproteobacteria bacterium]|nr:magnesium transporter [Deltaproteobacteria bacterium]MBW1955587.1 magnesium transporter [Deltaproteobacteria bacterium]MBW2041887.1 magnesium transporter [Deltaproteobacteria bacterium]MBW2132103.1 magnesium transporter [Deltaproteobacteria bacterium]
MSNDRNRILVESIKRLLRRGATSHLTKILNMAHAADLSIVFRSLSRSNQKRLFDLIDGPEKKGHLLMELDEDILLDLVEDMDMDLLMEILEELAEDDAADLLSLLPEEKADLLLKKMKEKGLEDLEDILKYDEETAGRIMVTDFIALKQDMTVKEAIEHIQKEHQDVEMPFYLYVVDEYGRLVGVSSLRQLVLVPPETQLKEIITTDVISVQTHWDQEEVARIVARYDFLAVPVVDESHRLVGIVTVDDVIDILRREATEDILKMAGAGEEFVETKSVFKSTRIRLPWLFASCVGGIIAFFVIGHFEGELTQFAYLAAFIPVIMGMGGNIGTQSSTIVVRGLATGRLHIRDIWRVVFKELAVGLILGVVYGVFIGTVAQVRFSTMALAVSVGLALICSMSVAALIGSFVPMAFARFHIDPAVATGPFVTTSIDIVSVFFYFQIATVLLGI